MFVKGAHFGDSVDDVRIYNCAVKGCYFRAGCYTQSNTKKGDSPDSYGEVVIHELKVTHTKPDSGARQKNGTSANVKAKVPN